MLECLTLLSGLRSRASDNAGVNVALYYIALKGVTRHGLQVATENIIQGSLGHPFLPDPPELRQECNRVMKPILEAQARDAENARILKGQKEMLEAMRSGNWTPESRARASEKWQTAKEAMREHRDQENAYDAAMARLQTLAESNGKEFSADSFTNASTGIFKQAGRAA